MFQKKLMSQFRENLQTHGWTDPILEDPSSQGQVSNKSSDIFTTATIPGKIDNNFLTCIKHNLFQVSLSSHFILVCTLLLKYKNFEIVKTVLKIT